MSQITDFASLRSALQLWVARDGDADFGERVDAAIDLAHAEIIKRLRIRKMQTQLPLAIPTDTREIELPPDFEGLSHDPYILDQLGWPLKQVAFGDVFRFGQGTDPGSRFTLPSVYSIHGDVLRIGPRTAQPITLVLPYYRGITSPELSTTNFLLENCPNIYFFGALHFAYLFMETDERAKAVNGEFREFLAEIASIDTFDRFNGSPLIQRNLIVPRDAPLHRVSDRGASRLNLDIGSGDPNLSDFGRDVLTFDVQLPHSQPDFLLDSQASAPLPTSDLEFEVTAPRSTPSIVIEKQLFQELSFESFEAGLGEWSSPGVEDPAPGVWVRTDTETPTGSTGPAGGANPITLAPQEGVGYAHVESSGSNPPDTYSLESLQFTLANGPVTLTFDYHQRFGPTGEITDGTLQVQGWNGSAWVNIGNPIVGSQQTSRFDNWRPSSNFGVYDSTGFSNTDFRFRFLGTRGNDANTFNYDFAVDRVEITGPTGALVEQPPPPPPPPPEAEGIIQAFSGADGVNNWPGAYNFPEPLQAHNRVNRTANPAPFAGSRSLQTEIRPGDPQWSIDANNPNNPKRRAEYSGRQFRFPGNQVGYAGAAFYLPSDPMATINGCTIFQLHNSPDPAEMMQFFCFGGRLRAENDGGNGVTSLMNLDITPFLDTWTTMQITFRPSTSGNGFMRLFLNGVEQFNFTGPNKPSGNLGPYFKFGAYFWGYENFDFNREALVLHDNIRLGDQTSSLASVDPNTFPRTD